MRAALRAARRDIAGLTLFRLDVYGPNTVARRLYEREGFVDYATLPGGVLHRGQPVDLVSMYRPADLPLPPD
jgi:RimJ/RimL family protein N-acetyltransferase